MINKYTYERPDTIQEAVSGINSSSNGKYMAGGTDLIGVINEKIKAICPDKIVSLKSVGLDGITEEDGKLIIGAMSRLSDIEASDVIREKYPVLWEAAHQVASPQLRHMATIGGNICQEPRCWYYRYQDDKFHCMRKGGDLCPAMKGENMYHSMFGGAKVCSSPCEAQCPNGTSIPEYFELIRKNDIDGAAEVLWDMNPLAAVVGRVCPHTCQGECNRNEYDESVSIRNIERTVGDYMLEHADRFVGSPEKESGKSVAIIGGGPAGLVAAYFLRREGHAVTIYDANEKAGGMLRYGIPAYRLPRNILDRIVEILEGMGIVFKQNAVMGKDLKVSELAAANDAVFVAIGAWKATPVGCPGDDADGVIGGIDFLKDASEHKGNVVSGKVVAVVGGGNTAMDCCRTAKRLGASKVYNFYRRTEKEMPAEEEEIFEAKQEGIDFHYLVAPQEVLSEGGKVKAIKLQKMELGEPDASGRRRPVPIPDAFETIEIDILLAAIGQKVDPEGLELEVNERNFIKTDDGHQASMAKVFSAGDSAYGPKTAIEAIADARKTADAINIFLGGASILREQKLHQALTFDESCMEDSKPLTLPNIPAAERKLDQEDNCSADFEAIRREANRCYNCGCVAVSPSDTAPALIALDAVIETTKREIPAKDFFQAGVDSSTVLEREELVKRIIIPEGAGGNVQKYNKFRTRATIDFPIAGLASNIKVEGGMITSAKLVFSGVAPVPYEFHEVEEFIIGKAPTDELAEEAGKLAIRDAGLLEKNLFKLQLVKAYIRRAVAQARS